MSAFTGRNEHDESELEACIDYAANLVNVDQARAELASLRAENEKLREQVETAQSFEATMKNPDVYDLRLVSGDAWLYWDETKTEWVVLKCARYQRRNSVLYRGTSLTDAIAELTK